jgi:uncharacterized protein YkwD
VLALLACLARGAKAEDVLSAEARQKIVELPNKFRRAATAEARQSVIEEARQLGDKGVARLRPLLESRLKAELKKYQPLFLRVAGRAAMQHQPLQLQHVLDDPSVAAAREKLIQAAETADLLGPPPSAEQPRSAQTPPAGPAANSPTAPDGYAEWIEQLEAETIEQLRFAASLRTLDADERATIQGLNQHRRQQGLAPFEVDAALCRAAKGHSHDMQRMGFFSHDSPVPGKRSFMDRAKLARTSASAENIAKAGNAPAAVAMWMKSQGHRQNILNPNNRRIGIGRSGNYYTTVFGR